MERCNGKPTRRPRYEVNTVSREEILSSFKNRMSIAIAAAIVAAGLATAAPASAQTAAATTSTTTAAPAAKPKRTPTPGQLAARERQKKCAAEWKEAKAAGKVEKGMKWPQYWSACNKRLKGAT